MPIIVLCYQHTSLQLYHHIGCPSLAARRTRGPPHSVFKGREIPHAVAALLPPLISLSRPRWLSRQMEEDEKKVALTSNAVEAFGDVMP